MPFTLSHTAAVLPFVRSKRLSASGLIIGTMVPDFEYFLRVDIYSLYGHKLGGLFYFDIPLAITLAFLFHQVARNNFIDNLPGFLQTRLYALRRLNFKAAFKQRPIAFIVSVLIGSVTHILWDGFTHHEGWFVQHMPFVYEGAYVPYEGVKYPLWYAMQHFSTVLGLLIGLIYVFWLMKPQTTATSKPNIFYWLALSSFMIAAAWIRWYVGIKTQPEVTIVIAMISGFCLGIILLGFVRFRNEIPPATNS